MKKRTKISLRTKIYLTIVALLSLTGVLYASNPSTFSFFPSMFPTGVAASPDLLLVSEFCSENIDTVDCTGTAALFATLPGFGSCREKYMTIAPAVSMAAGFTPRDVFVTEGSDIYRIDSNTKAVSLFTTLQGCTSTDHNGITFDHFNTFNNNMIVTCQDGAVFSIDYLGGVVHGNTAPIANVFASGPLTEGEIEGPAVVPPSFGPNGDSIWVADEGNGQVHAIGPPPTYTVTQNILSHVSTEGVFVIPSPTPCAFCDSPPGPSAFFQTEQQMFQLVWRYPLTDFTLPPPGLGGNVLLTSEAGVAGSDTSLVTVSGGAYVQTSFGPRPPGNNEGSSFVDCDVPPQSPTPTPSATSTPTATATATATPTATQSGVCPLTQGYWKNHPNAWPVNSLMLGSQIYTKMELLNILNTPSGGDASIILAKQLIAAKLNIANGSDPTPISSTITHADSLLSMFSGKLPYNVKPSSIIGQMMVNDANTLDNYNNGLLTPGCSGS